MKPILSSSLRAALTTRRTQLVARIQHLPPLGARPLVVEGRVAGWVVERAAQAMADLPGVSLSAESVSLVPMSSHGQSLMSLLAEVASTLRDAGCLRSWRNELLDLIGEGQVLSAMERAAFRPLGLLTKAVHLNAWTSRGELWIARRALTKSTDPGMWDTLVGGLVASGESLDLALIRESQEEAGLSPAHLASRGELRLVSRLHKRLPEGYQVEDALVSDCVLADEVEPCNQDGEVDAFLKADVETLWQLLQADEFTVEAEWVILDSLLRP